MNYMEVTRDRRHQRARSCISRKPQMSRRVFALALPLEDARKTVAQLIP